MTGSHSLRVGATISQAKWRLTQQFTRDVQPVTYNGVLPNGNLNPVSVTLRIPTDRRNSIKNDSGVFAQDKWTFKRATINAGLRWDWFISAIDPETLPAGTFNAGDRHRQSARTARTTSTPGCVGRRHQLEGPQPAHRRLLRPVRQRQDGAEGERRPLRERRRARGRQHHRQQQPADHRRPDRHARRGATSTTTVRRSTPPARCSWTSCRHSANTPNFGKNVASTLTTDPAVLNGWGARGYNTGVHRQRAARAGAARVGARRLVPPQVRQPDVDRRPALQRQEQLRRPVLPDRAAESEPARAAAAIRCAASTI